MTTDVSGPCRHKTIIAGGGLVGLTTANALRRIGHDVVVIERSTTIRATGSSLTIWPPSSAVFERYGLLSEIRRNADASVCGMDSLHRPDGTLIASQPFAAALACFEEPMYTIYRPLLNELLAASLGVGVQCGRAVVGYEERADDVLVHLSDGSTESADLLIGADGINSNVRLQMHRQARLVDAHYASWRAVISDYKGPIGDLRWVDGRRGTRGGFLRAGHGRVFWGIAQHRPEPPSGNGHKADALAQIAHMDDGNWGWPMREMVESTPEAIITRDDVSWMPPLPFWVTTRVALVGDAAHAMPPHVASGAAFGIEDAYELERALTDQPDVAAGLRSYDDRRRTRMAWVFDAAADVLLADNYGMALQDFVEKSLALGPQPVDILAGVESA